jgi:hypothetical protein
MMARIEYGAASGGFLMDGGAESPAEEHPAYRFTSAGHFGPEQKAIK